MIPLVFLVISSVLAIRFHESSPIVVDSDETITLPIKIESPRDGHSGRVRVVSDSGLALDLPAVELSSSAEISFSLPEDFAGAGFTQVLLETDTGAQCGHSLFIK